MTEIQKNKKDRTGIMFGFTVITIVGIILLMVITAFASTEAGPADEVLTAEQKNMLINYLGEIKKTGEVEAGTSTCSVTFYRKKLFGLIPRQTTHTLHYRGVDFSKFTVENLTKAFVKNIEVDCGGCEKEIMGEWKKDIVALKVRCSLKDGEWDFAVRKN